MLKTIFKVKKIKLYAIIAVGVLIFMLLFPIFAKFTENNATSQIITNYGYDKTAVSTFDGGNNYVTIPDDDKTEEELRQHLTNSGLWNATIDSSNEAQIEWYRRLSERLEKTYLPGAKEANDYKVNVSGKYAKAGWYSIEYTGDFGCQECDYNGPQENYPELSNGKFSKTCKDGGDIFSIPKSKRNYYKSEESLRRIGGKILGAYPDILVSASLANTYSLLDQNDVYGYQIEDEIINIQNTLGNSGGYIDASLRRTLFGLLNDMGEKLMAWYATFDNVASAKNALDDIFDEGSLYTTFQFMSDAKCKVKDLARYNSFSGERHTVINEYGNAIPYVCKTSGSVNTECVTETYSCTKKNPETGEEYTGTCTKEVAGKPKSTDGYPDSYYQHLDGTKSCDYIDGYELEVEWVCLPTTESPVKCSVTPVKDDRGEELYYICTGIDESEVRAKIVDPVFDAYEDNTLSSNDYMTPETAKKYIYAEDEEKEKDSAKGVNPKGYKIDEETRTIVTKHIVMEILGQIEGREPALADKDGNFYIQSYNRVLNKEQYKDALNNTIFVKDNLLRKEAQENNKEVDKDETYSEKLYGVFYSKYNKVFDGLGSAEIEIQKNEDKANKKSQIIEIFSTYDYVTYYLKTVQSGDANNTSGLGLGQADPDGFSPRTSAPKYEGVYASHLYGECAWYATGRIKEILGDSSIDISANGGDFCSTAKTMYPDEFEYSSNVYKPRKGSVISWKGHEYGHVAIVEAVNYDSNGKVVSIDITEAGLAFSGMSSSTKNYIWNVNGSYNIRKQSCEKDGVNKCWNARTIPINNVYNLNGGGYTFQCYIYLLKENSCPAASSYIVDDNILNYITNEFNSDDGIEAKVSYYNFLTGTEGGNKLYPNFTKEYLAESVSLIDNIEGTNYASVDPGLYIGEWNKTLSITINGTKYDFKLSKGCTVPRWVALYKFLEVYKSHRQKALNLISSNGLSNQINSTTKIHSLMRLIWTYGEGGATNKINELLSAYKAGGEHDMWCKLSSYVLATDNGTVKVFGNYFNMNEMIFELFTTGNYAGNRNYKGYKYYTYGRVNKLLNNGYPRYVTDYLESAMNSGEFPQSNSYSDCDGE